MRKTNKGITLVALVITVIILLILAGVAINALNNTDMIAKSEKATEEYRKWQNNTLSPVEEAYLETIKALAAQTKKK